MIARPHFHFAFQFDEHGSGWPVDWEEIGVVDDLEGWLWVDLDFESPESQQWITANVELPDIARRALFEVESRPGFFEFDHGVLIILRGVNLNEGARPEDMISIRIWLQSNLMITLHRRPLRSTRALAERAPDRDDIRTPGELFSELVGELSNRIVKTDDDLAKRLKSIEEQFDSGTGLDHELGEIRRTAAGLKRYLGPQKDTLQKIQAYQGGLLSTMELQRMRVFTERILQSLEEIEFIREQVMSYQDELNNRNLTDQNSRMYLLSIVAAIFLPLTFATGLLGMNVGGIPFANSALGFAIIVGISVAIAVVMAIYFKTRRWF